jgi:hypothetical protein
VLAAAVSLLGASLGATASTAAETGTPATPDGAKDLQLAEAGMLTKKVQGHLLQAKFKLEYKEEKPKQKTLEPGTTSSVCR